MLNVAFFSGPEPQRIESCLGCIKDVDFVTVALSGGLAPALRRRLRGGMRPDVVLIGGGIAPQEVPQAVHVLRAEAPKVAVVVVTDRTGLHALEEVPKGALTAVIASEELDRLAGILRYAARPRVRERAEQKDFAFFEARRPVGGVYVKDTGLRYVYADTTYAARLGQQPESLLGKTDEGLACEADLPGASAEERRVVESGEPLERIESIALEDGGPVEARLIRAPVRDDEGQVCGVLGRWDRADELGEELRRFPSSFRLTIGAGGAMLSWPPEAEKLFWRDATEALGWSAGLLVSPVDRAYLRERLRGCGTSGRAEAGDLTLVRSDGLWMKADMQLRFIGCGGAGAGATAAEGTITFWPPPEPEYPPGFESPEHVLDPIPDLTYRFDVHADRFDYISPWVDCLLGYDREELVQMGMAGMEQRLEPADRRRVREATRRLLRDRTASGPTRLDYSFQAKDGSNVGLVEDRYVLRARDGRPQCLVGAIRREGSDRVLRVSDTARSLPRVALETLTFKDCDLRLVWTWDVAAPPHGLAPERAVGLSDLELVPRHLARVWQAEDRAFLETVEDVPYMVSAMHYRALWMDVREQRKIGVFDSKGRPAGLLVTRTRVKQQDLDALSAYWTAVAVSTPDAVIGLDHAGRIAAWNPGAEALYGYSAEEIRGTRLDYIWRDPDSDVSSYLRRLAAGEIIRGEEAAHRAADGHWFPVSLSMSPVKAQEDIVMGYAIVAHDMAGTHEARQSLQQSEERLRRLVETVSDGISICEWEPDEGRLSLWLCNDRYVEMSGYSRQELEAADDLWQLRTSLESEQQQRRNLQRLKEGMPCTGTASWNRPDGAENYIEWSAAALQEDDRLTVYFVERDVTARRQRDEELRRSRDRFHIAAELAFEGIAIARWDAMRDTRKLVFCNDRFVEMSGYTRTELRQASDLGQLQSVHEDQQEAQKRYAHFMKGIPYQGHASWNRPDGQFNMVQFRALCRKVGDDYHLLTVERDATKQARQGPSEESGGG